MVIFLRNKYRCSINSTRTLPTRCMSWFFTMTMLLLKRYRRKSQTSQSIVETGQALPCIANDVEERRSDLGSTKQKKNSLLLSTTSTTKISDHIFRRVIVLQLWCNIYVLWLIALMGLEIGAVSSSKLLVIFIYYLYILIVYRELPCSIGHHPYDDNSYRCARTFFGPLNHFETDKRTTTGHSTGFAICGAMPEIDRLALGELDIIASWALALSFRAAKEGFHKWTVCYLIYNSNYKSTPD